jgi:hypothetical protein
MCTHLSIIFRVVKFNPGQKKAIKKQTTYDYWYRIQLNLGNYFFSKKKSAVILQFLLPVPSIGNSHEQRREGEGRGGRV